MLLESARSEVAELRATATREVTELRETATREADQARSAGEAEADTLLTAAREKADELVGAAERRARELGDTADLIWRERRRLVEDVRVVGEQLIALAETESSRFPRPITKAQAAKDDASKATGADRDLAAALQDAIDK
jgi:cell division septum initiation protein DivIVA